MISDIAEAPISPALSDAERDSPAGNMILPQSDLLYSTVERVKYLRGQIALLNASISDAYAEAKAEGLWVDEVKWLLVEDQLSPEHKEKRAERDGRRDQVWYSYQAVTARREAEAAKAAEALAARQAVEA
jgi:uncharacterized protein (UPF0335 family)